MQSRRRGITAGAASPMKEPTHNRQTMKKALWFLGLDVHAFMRVSPCLGAESSEASGVLADRSFVMDAGLLRHAHTSELPSPTVRVILHLCTV